MTGFSVACGQYAPSGHAARATKTFKLGQSGFQQQFIRGHMKMTSYNCSLWDISRNYSTSLLNSSNVVECVAIVDDFGVQRIISRHPRQGQVVFIKCPQQSHPHWFKRSISTTGIKITFGWNFYEAEHARL